ncbi:MAG TPA: serine/threonine-protein kinase, partial [Polyangiaceae bacterium]|nr:serine/threonine-protein kinase [Polyangiaceae bacterium]
MARHASAAPQGVDRIGPYILRALLGEGGMGVVYRAEQEQSGEQVALKVVRMSDENLLASFRREIFALRSIEHPCVARIVDDGVAGGHPWYAMAIIEGRTLASYIDGLYADPLVWSDPDAQGDAVTEHADSGERSSALHSEPPPSIADQEAPTVSPRMRIVPHLEDTLTLMRSICEPLAFVHGKGIVHRDLKPDNVVIRADGVPVLVDFGLALMFGGGIGREVLDVAGRALGTPPYMAPEQIRGDLVDARADLYALGCMLYECLTGVTPFFGDSVTVMNRHLRDTPLPPSVLVGGIPAELDALIMRLLAKRPRDRLGFAADVARTLEALGARPPSVEGMPAPRPYLYRPGLAGRTNVTRALEPAIAGTRSRLGGLVLIGGESGVGKTRLAMELATTAARRGMKVVTGQCVDIAASTEQRGVRAAALHPFRPLLLAIADRCRSLGFDETERLVADHAPVLAVYEPLFAHVPGPPVGPPPELPAEAARTRLLEALASVVARFSAVQPLFVVLDDLQWADEVSLAFLAHLDARYLASTNLLVVATYRAEETNDALRALLAAEHVRPIELDALDKPAVASMVGDMLALDALPSQLIDFLVRESEGNPFFIAEYLKLAIGERILTRTTSGVWTVEHAIDDAEALRAALPMPG